MEQIISLSNHMINLSEWIYQLETQSTQELVEHAVTRGQLAREAAESSDREVLTAISSPHFSSLTFVICKFLALQVL